MKQIVFFLAVICSLLVVIILLLAKTLPSHGDIALNNCLEDERLGYIPPGSCACASKLFPRFEQSYDWMDACYAAGEATSQTK